MLRLHIPSFPSPPLDRIAQQRYHRYMAMNREIVPPIDETATAAYAHLFQALAEPTRLAIVQHLSSGEHRVRDLVAHMGLAQSTVSKHISFLLECGLVTVRPEGRASWYALAEPALLRILIAAAERMLEATGNPAVLCSHLRPGGMADSERSA